MTNVIKKATNRWTKGLVMDFSPENTSNELLTNALNATLLTFNGNELSLQNDMGNARVETAFLPEGYIPVGTCEYGGIIYIVSYNPLEDKSQIGCFPSPERNVSSDELGKEDVILNTRDFQELDGSGNPTGNIINTSKYLLLKNDNLNPGDKFAINATSGIYNEKLAQLFKQNNNIFEQIADPILALNIVSIEDSGKIVYLNSDIVQYECKTSDGTYKYHILGGLNQNTPSTTDVDIDQYRNALSSGYSVFKSKTSGKLAILAELIMIDSYSVTHRIVQDSSNVFKVVAYTEVSYETAFQKYNTIPKLKYFYLEKSDGYFSVIDHQPHDEPYTNDTYKRPLYVKESDQWSINENFRNTKLSDIYQTYELLFDQDTTINNSCDFKSPEYYFNAVCSNYDNSQYEDIELGQVTIPQQILDDKVGFLFKYDYTILPCMNYGKLEHLAVKNSVDFSKLFDFEQSDFNVWKYHIDGNQLRLTFGADIYDTFSNKKVDALILEFYDAWGFAGSLTIQGYQSYSGVFTKLIDLNSIDALSQDRLVQTGTGYTISDGYIRNANISTNEGKYYYNNREIKHSDDAGWVYYDDETPIPNDCGILYPNLLYGIKAYFRTIESNTYDYVKKKDLFLYTLPIYNDKYYIVNDFSTLEYPELDFILTYKLEDKSDKCAYNSTVKQINDGFTTSDYGLYSSYINGSYTNESTLDVIKYYQYKGTTKLYLEVGLKKEYLDFGITCNPEINNYFECKLLLNNLVDKNHIQINYNENKAISLQDAVNYNWNDVNSIQLHKDGSQNDNNLELNNIRDYNFISKSPNSHISIDYEFVVGYKVNIYNIKNTEIPCTTVCALCHKKDQYEDYNYEDFGVYHTSDKFLSNAMIFNSGSTSNMIYGICKMLNDNNTSTMSSQCSIVEKYSETSQEIRGARVFNSGNVIKKLSQYIGKLTFCQPHAHQVYNPIPSGSSASYWANQKTDPIYGVNLYGTTDGGIGIRPYWPSDKNDVGGPTNLLNISPMYNLSCNTQKSLDSHAEFISNITGERCTIKEIAYINNNGNIQGSDNNGKGYSALKFTGLRPYQLQIFNQCMVETMKSVYAYNPDYDFVSLCKGDVQITDNEVSFSSNVLSTNAKFGIYDLNKFIYMYHICFFDYINNLNKYSNITTYTTVEDNRVTLPQLQFKPGYTYCGNNTDHYLITSMTYNTPIPSDLSSEFEYTANDLCVVKHNDGTLNLIKGIPDKNTLYTYYSGYLIPLDVSNYSINRSTGKLTVKDSEIDFNQNKQILNIDKTRGYATYTDDKYTVLDDYKNACLVYSSITINDLVYKGVNTEHRLYMRDSCGWDADGFSNGNRLCYRNCNIDTFGQTLMYKNVLRLTSGPSFTPSEK